MKTKKLQKSKLKLYKQKLLEEKEKLMKEVKKRMEYGKETSRTEVMDSADQATNSYESELLYGLTDTERKHFNDIEDALERIKDGSFGICSSCENQIGIIRLKAVPSAKFCIKCKEKFEKTGGEQ